MQYDKNYLEELSSRWNDFFLDDVPNYLSEEEDVDIKLFMTLVRETVEVLREYRPKKSTDDMSNWIIVMKLYGWIKAYSMCDAYTDDFVATVMVAKYWVEFFTEEPEKNACEQQNLNDFGIWVGSLPRGFAGNKYKVRKEQTQHGNTETVFIPINFETCDLSLLIRAIKEGGTYSGYISFVWGN